MTRWTLPIVFAIASAAFHPLGLLAAIPWPSAPATPASGTLSDIQMDKWTSQLSDPNFATREAATTRLRNAGWPAMSSLLIARAATKDAEAVARINNIIDDICWNRCTVSKASATSLKAVRDSSKDDRTSALMDLRGNPEAALACARAMMIQNGRPDSSTVDWGRTNVDPIKELINKGAYDEAEWALVAMSNESSAVSDVNYFGQLALLLRQTGQLPRMRQALTALSNSVKPEHDDLTNTCLHLALLAGDRDYILKSTQNRGYLGRAYVEQLLSEDQDWKALSELPLDSKEGRTTMVRAAALQFGGQRDMADALLKFEGKPFEANVVNFSGHAPLLLARTDLATQLYVLGKDYSDGALFLLMQRRYEEAFALVEQAKAAHYNLADAIESCLIVEHVRLNELDRARAMIATFTRGSYDRVNSGSVQAGLNRAQWELHDFRALADRLPRTPDGMVEVLDPFDRRGAEFNFWVMAQSAMPGSLADHLEKAARILDDQLPAAELEAACEHSAHVDMASAPPELGPLTGAYVSLWCAYRLKRLGQIDLPARYLESFLKVAPALPGEYMRALPVHMLSDLDQDDPIELIVDMKDWRFSRQLLEGVCAARSADPIYRYLLGLCMTHTGSSADGITTMVQADEELGADLIQHVQLARMLYRLGEHNLASAQARQVVQLDEPHNAPRYCALLVLANIAMDKGDYAQALQDFRLYSLDRIYYGQMPEDQTVYIRVPRLSAYCEARTEMALKHPGTALEAAKSVAKLDPEDLDLPLQLIAAFKQAHMDDQAKALTDFHRELLENILRDFPKSHLHHFLIARLDIRSGFKGATTQQHLDQARQLAPDNAEYKSFQ